jgi:DNA-directed RNA polymerase subunit RPC12/RpoP
MADTMTVQCNACGASYKVPETFSSNKFNCKKCDGMVFVRRRTTTSRRTAVTQVRTRKAPAAKLSRGTILSSAGLLVLIIVVVVLFIVK